MSQCRDPDLSSTLALDALSPKDVRSQASSLQRWQRESYIFWWLWLNQIFLKSLVCSKEIMYAWHYFHSTSSFQCLGRHFKLNTAKLLFCTGRSCLIATSSSSFVYLMTTFPSHWELIIRLFPCFFYCYKLFWCWVGKEYKGGGTLVMSVTFYFFKNIWKKFNAKSIKY
jgi:hypothetical protein